MEKFKLNELLKLLVITLLLISFSDMSYGYYEIMRFSLMSIFAWQVIIETEPTRKGWRFLFLVLAVLYNPFIKIQIDKGTWSLVNWVTIFILIINILDFFKLAYLFITTHFLEFIQIQKQKIKFEAQCEADSIANMHIELESFTPFENNISSENDRWIYLTENDKTKMYYNPKSSTKTHGTIKTWIKQVIVKDELKVARRKRSYQKYLFTMTLFEFDCSVNKWRFLKHIDYDYNGKRLETIDFENAINEWSNIVPNSIVGKIFKKNAEKI